MIGSWVVLSSFRVYRKLYWRSFSGAKEFEWRNVTLSDHLIGRGCPTIQMIRRNPSHSESTKFVASWQKHFWGQLSCSWSFRSIRRDAACFWVTSQSQWRQCDWYVSVTVTSVRRVTLCFSRIFRPRGPEKVRHSMTSLKMESSVVRRLVLAATLESQKDLPTINRCTDAETETETVCCIYTTPAWIGMGFGVWKEYRDRGNLPEKVSSHRSHDLFEIWLFAKREGTEFQNKWERWERECVFVWEREWERVRVRARGRGQSKLLPFKKNWGPVCRNLPACKDGNKCIYSNQLINFLTHS